MGENFSSKYLRILGDTCPNIAQANDSEYLAVEFCSDKSLPGISALAHMSICFTQSLQEVKSNSYRMFRNRNRRTARRMANCDAQLCSALNIHVVESSRPQGNHLQMAACSQYLSVQAGFT